MSLDISGMAELVPSAVGEGLELLFMVAAMIDGSFFFCVSGSMVATMRSYGAMN